VNIAGTRREEIIRFNKAKNDSEFAKMLKSRTLGPEHLETQTQLRRNIRVCVTIRVLRDFTDEMISGYA
jgi:nucleoporin NUP159